MSQQNISVGSAPNDGTGDPIRTAMIKIQNNFSEFYSAFAPNLSTNNVTAANNLTVTANVSANIVTAPIAYITSNAYVNIISTAPGSSANLYLDPDGVADVVLTNQTELWVLSNAQSTSVSTGAVVVNGGIGVANSIVVGQNVLATGTVNATSHTIGTNFVANSTAVASNGYITASNGFLSNGNYANAFADGIVVDYVVNNGRISVGAADNLSFYTGGVGSSVTASVNATGLYVTGLVNTTSVTTGSGGGSATGGITVNTSVVTIGNSTVNVSTNSTHFFAGNSTYYGFGNSTAEVLVNPTGNTVITPVSIVVSNATSNVVVANTTGVTISSNTLTLGTSTTGANGYTYLPNGLKMNWGWVSANSTTAGAVTFNSAFTTNAYTVIATSNSATATYQAAVVSWTKTGANVVTGNATSTNVFWTAIGY